MNVIVPTYAHRLPLFSNAKKEDLVVQKKIAISQLFTLILKKYSSLNLEKTTLRLLPTICFRRQDVVIRNNVLARVCQAALKLTRHFSMQLRELSSEDSIDFLGDLYEQSCDCSPQSPTYALWQTSLAPSLEKVPKELKKIRLRYETFCRYSVLVSRLLDLIASFHTQVQPALHQRVWNNKEFDQELMELQNAIFDIFVSLQGMDTDAATQSYNPYRRPYNFLKQIEPVLSQDFERYIDLQEKELSSFSCIETILETAVCYSRLGKKESVKKTVLELDYILRPDHKIPFMPDFLEECDLIITKASELKEAAVTDAIKSVMPKILRKAFDLLEQHHPTSPLHKSEKLDSFIIILRLLLSMQENTLSLEVSRAAIAMIVGNDSSHDVWNPLDSIRSLYQIYRFYFSKSAAIEPLIVISALPVFIMQEPVSFEDLTILLHFLKKTNPKGKANPEIVHKTLAQGIIASARLRNDCGVANGKLLADCVFRDLEHKMFMKHLETQGATPDLLKKFEETA